jgi:hypothetical protein
VHAYVLLVFFLLNQNRDEKLHVRSHWPRPDDHDHDHDHDHDDNDNDY